MRKHSIGIKHKFIFTLNLPIVTAVIVTVSIFHYLIGYNMNSVPGYVAIFLYAPPFLLALVAVNVIGVVINFRRKKRKS